MALLSYVTLCLILPPLGGLAFAALAQERPCFHPLKNIPAPKPAAATSLYEPYYDCILHGQFHLKINEMHKKYGWEDTLYQSKNKNKTKNSSTDGVQNPLSRSVIVRCT